ncbi:MAG: TonB-dependent receptor [Rhodospirillaceae bacterium]|nr:TonB-dependent receptor [Rhodospirillaceae bacterium]
MKRYLITTTSLVSLFAALPAFAEGEAPTPDVVGLDIGQLVVTATRTPQPLYRVGSSITVLSEDAIKSSQAVVVSDLITQTPGVSFSRNGGTGGLTSLRIRGAESDHTIVVIDGVKLNDPSSTGGGYNFANLLSGDISRIEILRGAQSTLWGSQAIGGVVNVVTAAPKKPFEASAEGEGGSRATGYGKLAAGGVDGKLMWRLGGDYYTTDGISAFVNGRERDNYQRVGATGRLRYDVTDAVSVDLRGMFSRGHSHIDSSPAPLFVLTDTLEFGIVKEYVGYGGVNFSLFNGQLKNRVAYTYTDTGRDNFNPDQAVTTRTFDARGKNKRFEYQGSYSFVEGWDATFGAEHEKSTFSSASPTPTAPNPVPAVANVSITSGYAQLQADVIRNLTITGGVRIDSHETFGSHALGQAAVAYNLNDGDTVLRASWGQGFKAPTLFNLYSDFGNTALKPESANSYDAGIEQHLFGDLLTLSATGFYRKAKDQIDFFSCFGVTGNPLCPPGKSGIYVNTGSTRARGVELQGSVDIDQFTVTANYTYTDTELTSAGNVNRGKTLTRRPKHQANLSASYQWPFDVATGFSVRYVGDTFDNAANTFVLQDYTLVDLRASWQVVENVELYGRIENVFNERYATIRNYGTPGRGAFAGARFKF